MLAPPTIMSPTDGATLSGTMATMSWSGVLGAAGYLIRCEDLTGSTSFDARNTWFGGPFLYIDKYSATSITLSVLAGHSYRFWVHAAKANFTYGDVMSWSPATEVRFSAVSNGGGVSVPGIVGWWRFDETSGGSVSDSSGNGNAGVLYNGPVWGAGKIGNALSFDGQDDYVQVPYRSSIAPQHLTVATWFRAATFANVQWNATLVNQGANEWDNGYYGMAVRTSGAPIAMLNIGGGQANTYYLNAGAVSVGAWHHVAMTYDNVTFKIYINGAQATSTTINRARTASSLPLIMGRRGDGGYYLKGTLDDVRIYSRVLSATEIAALAVPSGVG
jgi:hypothetical protein